MKVWTHRLAEDFTSGRVKAHPNGVEAGDTVFTDLRKLKTYIRVDGREWYICELIIPRSELDASNHRYRTSMMTSKSKVMSKEGYKPANEFIAPTGVSRF